MARAAAACAGFARSAEEQRARRTPARNSAQSPAAHARAIIHGAGASRVGGIVKKFMNGAESMLTESLSGFAKAHQDIIVVDQEFRYVRRKRAKPGGRVALISGGGGGHEPLHTGFVGHGMLDAACPGNVFTSPTPDQILAAADAVDCGGGVLFIVKNYAGDIMNFSLGAELYGKESSTLVADDDVAVERSAGRRGVAGTLVMEKMVGAAAERGDGLADLTKLGRRVNEMTSSMGVAIRSSTVPRAGRAT